MRLNTVKSVFLFLAMGAATAASRSAPHPVTVMTVPRSPTLIRFCADVNAFFPGETVLVVFDRRGPLALRVFEVWDPRAGKWNSFSPQQWREGRGLPPGPRRLLLIGPRDAIEPDVWQGLTWAREMMRVTDSDLSVVANRLDALFAFSAPQWRTLADRHGIKLQDRLAERRRYGRFGPAELRPPPPRPPTRFDFDPRPRPEPPPRPPVDDPLRLEPVPVEPAVPPAPVPETPEDVGGKAPPTPPPEPAPEPEPEPAPEPMAVPRRPPPGLDAALTLPVEPPEQK